MFTVLKSWEVVTHIFNKSLTLEKVPVLWKTFCVIKAAIFILASLGMHNSVYGSTVGSLVLHILLCWSQWCYTVSCVFVCYLRTTWDPCLVSAASALLLSLIWNEGEPVFWLFLYYLDSLCTNAQGKQISRLYQSISSPLSMPLISGHWPSPLFCPFTLPVLSEPIWVFLGPSFSNIGIIRIAQDHVTLLWLVVIWCYIEENLLVPKRLFYPYLFPWKHRMDEQSLMLDPLFRFLHWIKRDTIKA